MITSATILLTLCIGQVFTEFGCKNEAGVSADWFVLYKLPRNPKSKNSFEKVGEAYVYFDVKKGSWVGQSKSIEDSKSSLAYTYNQLVKYEKEVAYLIYNDQVPNGDVKSASWGHTKGILATDGRTGFWLVHSVPRFPTATDKYDYPENAKDNGQNLLCITFTFDQLANIVGLFRYTHPQIFARNTIKEISALPSELQMFFTGKPRYVSKPPFNTTVSLKSKGGLIFTVFAKHSKWGKDLYDSLVAPSLASSLFVQSWQVGAGSPLDADCSDPYLVYNVNSMALNYTSNVPSLFSTNNDHSKWAASQENSASWACVGDINRMKSQFKRGGGIVCLKNLKLWKAYTSIITKTEGCPIVDSSVQSNQVPQRKTQGRILPVNLLWRS